MLTGCWLCMMTSWLHHNDVISGHVYCVWWCHYYVMLTSSLSRSAMWVGSTDIRVGSAHPGEEDACDAWRASIRVASHPVGACGSFRSPISTRFSTVASSLPPLHSGMVKTQFWQLSFLSKIKHPFKPCALIPIVENSDRWYSDICPLEA
jgi:hypothetical protein